MINQNYPIGRNVTITNTHNLGGGCTWDQELEVKVADNESLLGDIIMFVDENGKDYYRHITEL